MIILSLCLSDIPKDKIKKAENGKCYTNLILSERKDVGQYGETHTLAVSKTKEEREAKVGTIYVGSGKLYDNKPVAITPEVIDEMESADIDELPF